MRRNERGAVIVVMITVLVVIDMVVVGIVLSGARSHDLTVPRLETVRAFYAAEAGMHMAIREYVLQDNQDDDCSVGTISNDGISVNDPSLGTASFMVTAAPAGSQTLIRSYGRSGSARREMIALLNVTTGGGAVQVGGQSSASMPADFAEDTLRFDHTIGSESDRVLVVVTGAGTSGGLYPVLSCTYNGLPLTKARDDAAQWGFSKRATVEIWYMLEANLPAAGTYEVAIQIATWAEIFGGATNLYNAAQQPPEAATSDALGQAGIAGPTTVQTAITTLTDGAVVVDALMIIDPQGYTADAGQAEWFQYMEANACMAGSTKLIETVGPDTLGWSLDGANLRYVHTHVLAAFAPAE